MAYNLYNQPVALPHPPVHVSVYLVLEEALCAAWDLLRVRSIPGFDFHTAIEDDVSCHFYEILFDEVFDKDVVDGFDRLLFTVGTRESKVSNFDCSLRDKMPDLFVGLVERAGVYRPTQDWIFIECKPVDANHSVGSHYCDKGIIRFVRGEYAWAMREALMIGYARTGYDLPTRLTKALTSNANMQTTAMPLPCPKSPRRTTCQPVFFTRHSRSFRYVETKQPAPEITIRHLWLKRD